MPDNTNENNTNNGGIEQNPQTPEWCAGIDPSLLTDKVRGFKDIGSFVKSYNEGQSFIGKGIPDDNTPEDIRNAFYTKLGRPESPDKYEWQPPEGISVKDVTDGEFKSFKELAFKAGLSNKQLNSVMNGWSDIVKSLQSKQMEFLTTQSANTTAALKKEWGDNYQERFDVTMKKLDALGIREHLESTGVLTPEVVKGFYGMISGKEETVLKGANGESVSKQERIRQLTENPAYLNSSHPDHKRVLRELNGIRDSE